MSRRILITAGSTREPIDPVRFIGNRSSGRMGAALVSAAIELGNDVTLIAGPASVSFPPVRLIEIETAADMHDAVLREFPSHDVLIMAAAVADFRPIHVSEKKLSREASLHIDCEPTADIVAAASRTKRADQIVVAFSLESDGDIERARRKMIAKRVDLMIFNSLATMGSDFVKATALSAHAADHAFAEQSKIAFGRSLIERVVQMCDDGTK